jgi:hypothetical protein
MGWAVTWVRTLGHPVLLPAWPDFLDILGLALCGAFVTVDAALTRLPVTSSDYAWGKGKASRDNRGIPATVPYWEPRSGLGAEPFPPRKLVTV